MANEGSDMGVKTGNDGMRSGGITLYDLGFVATLSWHFLLIMQPGDFFRGRGTLFEWPVLWAAIGVTFLCFYLLSKSKRNCATSYSGSSRFCLVVLLVGVAGSLSFSGIILDNEDLGVALRVLMLVAQGVAVAFFVSVWMLDYLRDEKDSLAIRILARFVLAALLALAVSFSRGLSGAVASALPFVSAFILVVSNIKVHTKTDGDGNCEVCSGGGFFVKRTRGKGSC